MGMSVGGGSGGLNSEPNVVPMIDIMLVLLIIFMIMQPMMRKAVDLTLPDPTPQVVTANTASDQIVLEILPDGKFQINKQEAFGKEDLAKQIMDLFELRPEKIMFVKGDPSVQYQDVIHAIDVSRGAGVKVIGIPPKDTQ